MQSEAVISPKSRNYIILASLLALFLGALDALVMSAAMPTIVADLSGLHLYSWVYSAYLLARAVALCRALGVNAVGVQTTQLDTPITWYSWAREVPAIHKAVLDVLCRRTPRFPGPREHDLDAVNVAG